MTLPRLFSNDELEKVAEEVYTVIDDTAKAFILSNLFVTIALTISVKSMWNLLNVMQVLTFMRFFTSWPAIMDSVLEEIYNVITMRYFIDPIVRYGKSKFQLAREEVKDEY